MGSVAADGADERRSPRSNVILTAIIEHGDERLSVRVLNLSAHGALVQGDVLPDIDQPLTFVISDVTASGWVAWVKPPLAGINFEEKVKRGSVRPKPKGVGHMVIRDNRKIDFRRPGFRGNQMSDEERRIVEEWMRENEGK